MRIANFAFSLMQETTTVMSKKIISKLAWYGTFWISAFAGLSISKIRLESSWNERERDALAAEAINRHFECSWEEGIVLQRTLAQDLRRKLDNLFAVNHLLAELEVVREGSAEQIRALKLSMWEQLKVEGTRSQPKKVVNNHLFFINL